MNEISMSTNDLLDTADEIDPAADDPTPAEIADTEHADFVSPYADATPIGDAAS